MNLSRSRRLLHPMLRVLLVVSLLVPGLALTRPAHATPLSQGPDAILQLVDEQRSRTPDFVDDFAVDSEAWTTTYDEEVSTYFKGGERRIAIDAADLIAWTRLQTEYDDFYVEVDTIEHAGQSEDLFGLIFRYQNVDNFYIFAIGSDGYYMVRRLVNDEWSYLAEWTESDEIDFGPGAVNTLGLVAQGDTFTVLVNDVVLAQVQDDGIDAGAVGLVAGAYEDIGVDIGFDNFRLWELSSAEEPPAVRGDRPGRLRPTATPDTPATPAPTEEPEATATPPVSPIATPAPEVETVVIADPAVIRRTTPTFDEPFDAEPEGWIPQLGADMRYGVVDGALEFGIDSANSLGWTVLPHTSPDYYMEVDTVFSGLVSEAEYGILFRVIDAENFYFFAINNLGMYSVWQLVDNEWNQMSMWAEANALESGEGAANRLGVLAQGDLYQVYANDILLVELVNPSFVGGGLALAVGTFADPEVTITFDNVRVWDLEPQAAPSPESTPVAPEEPTPTAQPEPEATATPEPEATPAPEPEAGDEGAPDVAAVQSWVDALLERTPDITDDFRRDTEQWSVEDGEYGQIFFARRAYHVTVTSTNSYLYGNYYGFPLDVGPGDFYGEITMTFADPESDGKAGWVIREKDNTDFYFLYISATGAYEIYMRQDSAWTPLQYTTQSAAWDAESDSNRVGIYARGPLLALVVNGQVETVLSDANLTEGNIGVGAQSGADAPHEVIFDDFELWLIEE